jgi:response regulator RpfG family c-di-GMP phosphodiesterase
MPRQNAQVLYVDDQVNNLEGFKANFRRSYNVFTAVSAEEARKILSENEIHVLIVDQKMPETLGTELLEEAIKAFPIQVRILLSAYTDREAIVDAFQKGLISKYMLKPYNPEDLKELIDSCYDVYTIKRIKEDLYLDWIKNQGEAFTLQIKNEG